MPELTPPVVLTIAGSDSGGGAGIQADLRTFAFLQVHGTSVITCVTAQNTLGVTRVDALPLAAIRAQFEAVVTDFPVLAIKTGMLLNVDIIETVAACIQNMVPRPALVVDPVMVSRTGAQLLTDAAIVAMQELLLPLATVITPNCYEATLLSAQQIFSNDDMVLAAAKIYQRYVSPDSAPAVLVKGGGLKGQDQGTDVWHAATEQCRLEGSPIPTRNTHGTGCTLAAAIAAHLSKGATPLDAVQKARVYVRGAINHALAIGQGQGPIGHFFPLLHTQSEVF